MSWFLVFSLQPVLGIPVPQRGRATRAVAGWVLGKGPLSVGSRAVLKRDISPFNSITQNKKPKLEHSAINAGSIDSCAAPSWLINPRCSYKPIPAPASPQREPNGRISEAEIPSRADLSPARSSRHHTPTLLPKTTSAAGAAEPPSWEMPARGSDSKGSVPPASARDQDHTGMPFWM